LILLFVPNNPSNAQTTEAAPVTVTGEPIPTPTPYDNWREIASAHHARGVGHGNHGHKKSERY
jgi:hypothetical protein